MTRRGGIDRRTDFHHGTVGQNQTVQLMDPRRIGIIDLAIGLLPDMDYHCCRCRRFPMGKI